MATKPYNKKIVIEYNIGAKAENNIASIQNIIFKQFQLANEIITSNISKSYYSDDYTINIDINAVNNITPFIKNDKTTSEKL